MYNFGDGGTDSIADGDDGTVVRGGVSADCDCPVRERVVRASRGMRGGVGTGRKWRVAVAGATDGHGGWEFERSLETWEWGSVCLETEANRGDRREVESAGEVSCGIGRDFSVGGKAVIKLAPDTKDAKAAPI